MPRINESKILALEDNLMPTFVDPRHNRNSEGSIVIDRMRGKRVELVDTRAIEKKISQFQGSVQSVIRHVVDAMAKGAIDDFGP